VTSRYVPGSQEWRHFESIEGCLFFVYRNDDSREVGFYGQGRDGDYVPAGAPEPDILARLVADIPGLSPAGQLCYRAESAEVLDRVEQLFLERAGNYVNISRQVWGHLDAARGILAAPREPGWKRTVYLSGPGPSLNLEIAADGSGVVNYDTQQNVAAADIPAFLAAALERLGPHDVRVIDEPD